MHVLRTALQKELGICYPIGAVLGGLAAMANEHLRARVHGGGAGTAGAHGGMYVSVCMRSVDLVQ
jgi:hypothetical protein